MQGEKQSGSQNRVAIYIRVSTTHQIDKDSIPMQRNDLVSYARLMLNTDDYAIFEDAGYSGKNTDRPNFQKMMSQIRSGAFTHLLVWKIDRISRNLLDFSSMYKELKELGVVFVSKNEQFDTSTAMGEAMLKIILVFAELERNMTSERVSATMISRASNGQWNGGRVPFGYDYDPETKEFSLNETESRIVNLIHDSYEEMRSLVREARMLNEKGLRTRVGNLWNPVSLHIILHNLFYCGDYQYNVLKEGNRQKVKNKSEWVVVENHHVPIVTKEQKYRIISLLDANKRLNRNRNTYQSEKYIHVFGGLIFCGSCGKPMGASPAAQKKDWQYSKYICPTRRSITTFCNAKSTSDPIVGEFIFNYVLNILNAQKNFSDVKSTQELQSILLTGEAFSKIDYIETDGLNDLYNMLASEKVKGLVFGKSARAKNKKVTSELTRLRNEKQKLERALDRIMNIYLFSEDAMSESEFIARKSKLVEALDEVNEQIGFSNSEEWNQSVSDEEFVHRASEFIITKKMTDRNYISYKRLATTVDASVIRSFVQSIVDSIIMDSGRVKQIVFKNGLSHTFIYK